MKYKINLFNVIFINFVLLLLNTLAYFMNLYVGDWKSLLGLFAMGHLALTLLCIEKKDAKLQEEVKKK